jgi:hypothetical protein
LTKTETELLAHFYGALSDYALQGTIAVGFIFPPIRRTIVTFGAGRLAVNCPLDART